MIDVQGYYSAGNGTTAPGGYVPVNPTSIVDTRTGTGLPQARLATNSTTAIQVGGVAGVPANASAVFVMLAAINPNTSAGYFNVYPGGTSRPANVSVSYPAATTTLYGTAVGLGTSGQFNVWIGPNGSSIDFAVTVVGYYTATTAVSGAFTPAGGRVYDTRVAPNTIVPANGQRQIQLAGVNGVPLPPTGVSAYAVNAQVIHSGTHSGYLALGQLSTSTVTTTYFPTGTSTRNDLGVVTAADDGTVWIVNSSADPIDVVLDIEGYYATNDSLPQLSGTGCMWSGVLSGTQPMSHQLTDSAKMSLNPTSGNLNLTGTLLHLRGVEQDLTVAWRYNNRNDTRPSLSVGLYEMALQPWTDGSFVYTGPDGACYRFNQATSTSWTTPKGINATLTSPSSGTMALRFNPSGISNIYQLSNGVWVLRRSEDKNSTGKNTISYAYASAKLSSITDTQGRQVNFAYADPNNALQPSSITDTSLSRTIGLTYGGPSGALSQLTDATGAHTNFGYNADGLSAFTDDRGDTTAFAYDSLDRLASWTFGSGTSVASHGSASYDSNTQTSITDGLNHTAVYTINYPAETVAKIVDAKGNETDSSWNSHNDPATSTAGVSGSTGNVTTYSFQDSGANPNNMLAKVSSPNSAGGGATGGTSQSLTYPTAVTGGIGDFLPLTSTDGQGNTSNISYDANTHQANNVTHKNASGTSIPGAESSTIQGDSAGTNCGAKNGEVCSTTDDNGNVTSYGYDASGNVTTQTLPAPLGARTFTYDAAGRVHSATDGRGNTAYYTYDGNDRTTKVSYSATTCPSTSCVSYVFDGTGNLTSRTSATETTSFGYDALNRPTTKTQGGVLISTATYDAASNITSYTDASGSVAYNYDTANNLWTLAEPGGSCPNYPTQPSFPNSTKCTWFHYDNQNRRDQVHYPSGQYVTVGYDNASRITSVSSKTLTGTVLTSRTYAYQSATGGGDQALRASVTDSANTVTAYTYDGKNRLLSSAVTPSGGSTTTSSWTYDNNGNRQTAAKTGTTTKNSAYNTADEICWTSTSALAACNAPPAGSTTYGFDTSGNQTTDALSGAAVSNSFNVFNQVIGTTVAGIGSLSSTYTETSNTERLSAGATSFLTGTLGMASQTSSGMTINFIRDPYGNLIALHTSTSGSYYYTTDAQGSVILLTDSDQTVAAKYTYDAWGNPTSTTGSLSATNPWRYAGGYLDGTGYYKLGARYYNPTTGRFTQPDPSHQEANNYAYASDDPINNTDPTGLIDFPAVVAGTFAGAVVGAGASLVCNVCGIPIGAATGAFVGTALASADSNNGSINYGQALIAGGVAGATSWFGPVGKTVASKVASWASGLFG